MQQRSRPALVLGALGASFTLGACQDDASHPTAPTAPTPVAAADAAPAPARGAMTALGATFQDATDPFLGVLADQQTRLGLRTKLSSLADHLAAGDADRARADLKAAREYLRTLERGAAASELAPVDLALEQAALVLEGKVPGAAPADGAPASQP